MAAIKPSRIEYMCSACGRRETRAVSTGRPQPGTCPRKKNGKAHTWVVNRKF